MQHMSDKTFNKGDIVFTSDGQQVQYIAEVDGEHIVRPQLSGDDEDSFFGDPVSVELVFASAPKEVYDQTIADLNKQIEALTDRKDELEDEIRRSRTDETARKKRIMVNAALTRIDEFLAGKITHLVIDRYGIEIVPFDKAMEDDYSRRDLKLLTLYGRTNGNLAWMLNQYSDGSGSKYQAWPCTSMEEARTMAAAIIEAYYIEFRKSGANEWNTSNAVKSAQKLGFPVPLDIWQAVKAARVKEATRLRDQAKKSLDDNEAALATVEQEQYETT
jgi:hypothetical protein